MKRSMTIGLAALSVIILAGCGSEDSGKTVLQDVTSPPTQSAEPVVSPPSLDGGLMLPSVKNQDVAVLVVKEIYSQEAKSDSNLRASFDHTEKDGSMTVYVIHVYDDMENHTATLGWIGVRSDGHVKDLLMNSQWVAPQQFNDLLRQEQHP